MEMQISALIIAALVVAVALINANMVYSALTSSKDDSFIASTWLFEALIQHAGPARALLIMDGTILAVYATLLLGGWFNGVLGHLANLLVLAIWGNIAWTTASQVRT